MAYPLYPQDPRVGLPIQLDDDHVERLCNGKMLHQTVIDYLIQRASPIPLLSRVKKHELNIFFAFLGSKLLFVQKFSCLNVGKIGNHSSQNSFRLIGNPKKIWNV